MSKCVKQLQWNLNLIQIFLCTYPTVSKGELPCLMTCWPGSNPLKNESEAMKVLIDGVIEIIQLG